MKRNQMSTTIISSFGYNLWPNLHRLSIFGLGTRLWCRVTTMTSRCSTIGQEQEKLTCWFPPSFLDYADAIGWFRHILQARMIAPDRFNEASVWFHPGAALFVGRGRPKPGLLRGSRLRPKSAEPLLSDSFTYISPSKRGAYSYSALCSFFLQF